MDSKYPFEPRIGSTGLGIWVGCGAGVGILTPIPLHSIPLVGQIAGSLRHSVVQIDARLGGGLARKISNRLNSAIKPIGIQSGFGCGVALGFGYGAGLFLKPGILSMLGDAVKSKVPANVLAILENNKPLPHQVDNFSGGAAIRGASSTTLPLDMNNNDKINNNNTLLSVQQLEEENSKSIRQLESEVMNLTKLLFKQQVSLDEIKGEVMQRPPSRGGSKAFTAAGLIVFVAAVASYPVLYATKGPRVSDKALNNDAIIRGAYINTGSKDIGPDPKAFTYNSKSSNS